jgi:uncharacterized protein YcfL
MKKLLFVVLIAGTFVACNSNDASKANDAKKDSSVNPIENKTDSLQSNVQENADSAKARLERNSDSVKHKVEEKFDKKDSVIKSK